MLRKTCPKKEYLEIKDSIKQLASEVLNKKQIKKADELAEQIAEPKSQREARAALKNLLPRRPKRPLYYCRWELNYLPRWTRDSMRDLGDYVDFLVKCKVFDRTKNQKQLSLGQNLYKNSDMLKNEFGADFLKILTDFNRIYVDAKHNFNTGPREHFFTPKEVVYTLFIVVTIGKTLIKSSEFVKKCAEDKIHFDSLAG